jgi:tetratricopeptide (TPR) repeat protein
MYAKGVTCSDCHDPHSGQLKLAGNATCTACHQSSRYDATNHHFHSPGSQAAACVTCHMPIAAFMVIDRRHDHSFRIPRPDRTDTLGVPNVCTGNCHRDKGPSWAAQQIHQRVGHAPDGYQTFAEVFGAADRGTRGASDELLKIAADPNQPAIVRGGALERLSTSAVVNPGLSDRTLSDPSPMVRRLAVAAFAHADDRTRLRLIPRLLNDPIRTVRIQAAMCLADLADTSLAGQERMAFDRAFDEFVAEQQFNADRPEAQTNLGQVLIQRTRIDAAVEAFREAIQLDRTFIPAYIDLADAYRLQGKESSAERALRDAIATNPAAAAARHALGLTLVRQHRPAEAIPELARAVALEPDTSRYSYVYSVALHDTGNPDQAIKILEASVGRHPDDRDSLLALSIYLESGGRLQEARRYVARLLTIDRNDPEARALSDRIASRLRGVNRH